METLPMPLAAMDGADAGLAEFRVELRSEIATLLEQLADAHAVLTLSTPEGASTTATVWAMDAERDLLCLSADAHDVQLQGLLESHEVVAVGYLDKVKLQFDLHDMVLVRSLGGSALNVQLPQVLYRFPRRGSLRVRPLANASPVATLRHPAIPAMELALRVIDVSFGGVALFLPEDVPMIEPGVRIDRALVELDADTRLPVALSIRHITMLHHESRGVRLGCELHGLGGTGERALQRYIDLTQRRRRLLLL